VGRLIAGRPLVAGEARGAALASREPLSFWGGYDQNSGEIIDRRHPLSGANAAGKILVLPMTRGSSTTAAVFLEAVRQRTAPAAVVTDGTDRFLTLAAIVAEEMYGRTVPIVAVDEDDFELLSTGMQLRVQADGSVQVEAES